MLFRSFISLLASIIGVLAGDSSKELQVISEVGEEHINEANKLMNEDYCFVERLDTDIQLHIVMEVYSENDSAIVEIKYAHNNISKVIKNGEILFEGNEDPSKYLGVFIDRSILNVNDIYEFANTVDIKDIKELLDNANKLEETLSNFGVEAKVVQVTKGPSVTRFELQPSPGVKV